jgi:hypothetical protein
MKYLFKVHKMLEEVDEIEFMQGKRLREVWRVSSWW